MPWRKSHVLRFVRALLAALLLAAPGAAPTILAAPILAAPGPVAPRAPQAGCGFDATLVTDSQDDLSANTLREAIACATNGQTVVIDPIVQSSTVHLLHNGIPITQSITIDGSAAPGFTVDAGDASRVFNITASGPVTLTALTLQHGLSPGGSGGAVMADPSSPLVLDNVSVISSTAPLGVGGGVYAGGDLTVSDSSLLSNTSLNGGGGAYVGGSTALTNDLFQGNRCTGSACSGGGLLANSTLAMSDTVFFTNTSLGHGGGIEAGGTTALTSDYLQGNQCQGSGCQGGGLAVFGTLTLTDTTLVTNTSQGSGGGAAVGGSATANTSYFGGNQCIEAACAGGGLAADSLWLNASFFIHNLSSAYGGGAAVTGLVAATGSRFQDNQCLAVSCQGGGLAVGGSLALTSTTFIHNASTGDGGGVLGLSAVTVTSGGFHDNDCTQAGCLGAGLFAGGPVLVTGSSFQEDRAAGWGGALGITATTQLTLANDTLDDNSATISGGGLYLGGHSQANLYNVTVADNQAPSGGGLFVNASATAGVSNTIVAGNTADNCAGPIASGTHNLEFPGNACATAGPGAGFSTADPLLGPLALNPPGTTLSRALLPGSPALHTGSAAVCAAPPVNGVDQRGAPRMNDGDGAPGAPCDIGAFEAGPWRQRLPLVRR